jgi:hypothetical protein
LQAAAQQRPSHFIPSLWKYRELDANRYLAILEGCLRSGIEGGEVDWPRLLKETEISIRKVILPAANAASEMEGSPDVGIEIIRALENVMTSGKSRLPIECRDANEKTLAGRGVFGERLPWLIYFHREWVAQRLLKLFPSTAEDTPKRKAVWNCFVTMTWASVAGLELLRSEYALAVEDCAVEPEEADFSQEEWAPGRSLVHHLRAFY